VTLIQIQTAAPEIYEDLAWPLFWVAAAFATLALYIAWVRL
jgi:hypothetical protein